MDDSRSLRNIFAVWRWPKWAIGILAVAVPVLIVFNLYIGGHLWRTERIRREVEMVRDLEAAKLAAAAKAAAAQSSAVQAMRSASTHIIILANTHWASRDDFAADLRNQDATITDADIDEAYAAFLDDVERLQNAQAKRLRALIRENGIKAVHVEGVTDANLDAFRAKVDELAAFPFDHVHGLMTADDTDFAERAMAMIEMESFRADRLKLGAVGMLMMADEPIDVAPLDEEATMAAADPSKLGWRFDGPENAARERAMVKRLLEAGPVAVAVIGKDHDLRGEIAAECAGCRVEVVRTE